MLCSSSIRALGQIAWVSIWPLTSCVTLGSSFDLSVPQFPIYKMLITTVLPSCSSGM